MKSWQPYLMQLRRLPDFLVSYRFYSTAEGGRRALPYQGYRSDLRYEHNHSENGKEYDGNYMVWPEFLTEDGVVIEVAQAAVPVSGKAYMWIVNDKVYRGIHRKLAVPGARCWFMEGSRRVAEAEVVERLTHLDHREGRGRCGLGSMTTCGVNLAYEVCNEKSDHIAL